MFSSPIKVKAHYTVNHGAIYVYYDNERQFNASLDILFNATQSASTSDTDAKKLDQKSSDYTSAKKNNSFCSLNFTYHDKSQSQQNTVLFSIMKQDENIISIRLTNVTSNFIMLECQDTNHMSEIAKLALELSISRQRYQKFISAEDLLAQTKQLLEQLTILTKELLDIPRPKNGLIYTLDKICLLLKMEKSKFDELYILNTTKNSVSSDQHLNNKPAAK